MKILLYTDLAVRTDQLFWHRDLGLLTKAFRDLGHEACLVVHLATEPGATLGAPNELDLPREQPFDMSSEALAKEEAPPERSKARTSLGHQPCEAQQGLPRPGVAGPILPHMRDPANAGQNPPAAGALPTFAPSHIPTSATSSKIKNPKSSIQDDPVLWVSQQDVRAPLWWKDHHPDLVILGLWTRPKYDSIRRAALFATPRVIERADSDGMRTASCGLFTYAKRRFDYFRDRTYHWPSPLSIFASIFYSCASILSTPWIEYRLRKTLALLPSILVETPHATVLWKSLATRLRYDPEKIHCIPHPIQTDIFKFDPAIPKKNQIICVGRWESYQKNYPELLRLLRDFLSREATWSSIVVGTTPPPQTHHPRIRHFPFLSPKHLARLMRESRVFLFSSRYESFLLAGAEALTAGCSVVGPEGLPSTSYFSEFTRKNQPLKLGKSRLSVNNNKRSPPNKEIRLSSLQSCRATFCFSPISVAKNILKIMSRQESGL